MRGAFDTFRTHLTNLLKQARQYVKEPKPELKSTLDTAFREVFAKGRLSPDGNVLPEFLAKLRAAHGDAAMASALLAMVLDQPSLQVADFAQPDSRLGFVSASLFQLGIDPLVAEATQSRLSQLLTQFENELKTVAAQRETFAADAKDALVVAAAETANRHEKDRASFEQVVATFQGEASEAVKSFKGVEAAYTEQMHLQAAVNYWAKKAKDHRTAEQGVRAWLIWYTIGAVLALIGLLITLTSLAGPAIAEGQIAQYVKYAAIGVLVTTVAIWVGRVLLRFMISERHLAIDAEERVTMVLTYLALTKESTLEGADRPLVLSALFRAGSDGIVKDDGSPETMLTALAGRMLDRVAK